LPEKPQDVGEVVAAGTQVVPLQHPVQFVWLQVAPPTQTPEVQLEP
jgi:hypothetical protein